MFASLCSILAAFAHGQDGPFRLRVYDEATGRGVPLVEVEALTNQKWITDSNGLAAIDDPVLMNQTAFFHIRSHGYEIKKDGFGFAGRRIDLKPGGKIDVPIKRNNIAERLYRLTGGGIYRHTVALGEKPPIKQPLLSAQLLGCDSVQLVPYKGKLYWFWGDTQRVGHPLGNFHTTGATSLFPGKGGLDPDVGVDFDYFTKDDGFVKGVAQMPGEGPTWIGAVFVLPFGDQEMYTFFSKVRNTLDVYSRGQAKWNDQKQAFEHRITFTGLPNRFPSGHCITVSHSRQLPEFFFCDPAPLLRAAQTWKVAPVGMGQIFSCAYEEPDKKIGVVRHDDGRVKYYWASHLKHLDAQGYNKLVKEKKLKPDEIPLPLRDPDTGKRFTPHAGSTVWNAHRQKWIMVTTEIFGTSLLGELWYAEADSPVGPWVYARKILTHDNYSFYNPKLHQVFFKDGGRIVYLEGTYTTMFTNNKCPTPDYDYNQIMYKMNLADPRLNLPTPIYEIEDQCPRFVTRNGLTEKSKGRAPFCALDRPGEGMVPVLEDASKRLTVGKAPHGGSSPLFFALPPTAEKRPASAVAVHERFDEQTKRYFYSVRSGPPVEKDDKLGVRIMYVWENPKADEPTVRAEEVMSYKDATPAW